MPLSCGSGSPGYFSQASASLVAGFFGRGSANRLRRRQGDPASLTGPQALPGPQLKFQTQQVLSLIPCRTVTSWQMRFAESCETVSIRLDYHGIGSQHDHYAESASHFWRLGIRAGFGCLGQTPTVQNRWGRSQAGKYGGAIVRMTLFQQMGSWIILSGRKFPWLLCASEVRVGPLDWVWRR